MTKREWKTSIDRILEALDANRIALRTCTVSAHERTIRRPRDVRRTRLLNLELATLRFARAYYRDTPIKPLSSSESKRMAHIISLLEDLQ